MESLLDSKARTALITSVMLPDWVRNKFTSSLWLKAIGDNDNPFGDLYRETVVNPGVLSTFMGGDPEGESGPGAFKWSPLSLIAEIETVLRGQDPIDQTLRQTMHQWHRETPHLPRFEWLRSKRVLDLGCGDGYIGRWFAGFGMSYVGFDAVEEFVRKGTDRFLNATRPSGPRDGQFSLQVLDLDKENLELDSHSTTIGCPDFVLISCLLEHLTYPQRVIGALSEYLTTHAPAARVVVLVANPDYICKDGVTSSSQWGKTRRVTIQSLLWLVKQHNASLEGGQLGIIKLSDGTLCDSPIAESEAEVDVVIRPWHDYARLFRANHFRMLSFLGLRFPPSLIRNDKSTLANCRDIAPFWLMEFCLPAAVIRRPTSRDLETLQKLPLWQSLDQQQCNSLLKHAELCRVYEFESNQEMLSSCDVGEGLWVVLDGDAVLSGQSIMFTKGDILGELELPDALSSVPAVFRYGCYAGRLGCKALVIPSDLVGELPPTRKQQLKAVLFEQLRNRLRPSVWLQYTSGRTDRATKANPWIVLPYVASSITWAVEAELQARRSRAVIPGDCALLSISEIVRIVSQRSSAPKPPNYYVSALYVLVSLGIVDALPPVALTDESVQSRRREVFRHFCELAFNASFSYMRKPVFSILSDDTRWVLHDLQQWNATTFRDRYAAIISVELGRLRRAARSVQDTTRDNEACWQAYENVRQLSRLLLSKRPYFFVVRQPWLLRAIAARNKRGERVLDDLKVMMNIPTDGTNASTACGDVSTGRCVRYLALLEGFLKECMKDHTDMFHFSGSLDRNIAMEKDESD